MMALIVGIRFHKGGKTYHFDASSVPDIHKDDYVIVETSRGKQLGNVVSFLEETHKGNRNWKPILRAATPRDLVLRQVWEKKEIKVLEKCREFAHKDKGLEEVKFVSAEFSLEGNNLVVLYCFDSEGDPKLAKVESRLKKSYPDVNLELRRIGPRDTAKILGGMGACGREIRCCTEFMTEFKPISIKMAKEQGISLAPSEITGMCGRLRCCLMHENDLYRQAKKNLPKRGKRVMTPQGEGKVVRLNPLSQIISVDLGEEGIIDFEPSDLKRKKHE
jgi:cell fate regulator YaaT (PSP1 superfamily)